MSKIELIQGDCLEKMKDISNRSIDCILTDPPYLYLKNQKFDKPFDENIYFSEVKRVLKDDGFIVLFGRGASFYRWNTTLSNLSFNFKEEIIWEKERNTSPFQRLLRVHETISIYSKGNGIINKCRVPYLQQKKYNIESIVNDIKRLKVILNNFNELNEVENFLSKNIIELNREKTSKYETTAPSCKSYSRCVAVANIIKNGVIEKDIIKVEREYYKMLHPTQKPVRLLERLLNLTTKENDIVLDSFMGSGSTGVACVNTNRNFIGIELDENYFNIAKERIEKELKEKKDEK